MLEESIVSELLKIVVLVSLAYYQYILSIIDKISFQILYNDQFLWICRDKIVVTIIELGMSTFHDVAIHIL